MNSSSSYFNLLSRLPNGAIILPGQVHTFTDQEIGLFQSSTHTTQSAVPIPSPFQLSSCFNTPYSVPMLPCVKSLKEEPSDTKAATTLVKAASTKEENRKIRKQQMEKNRRDSINNQYSELADLLEIPSSKREKVEILRQTVCELRKYQELKLALSLIDGTTK